ncbi:hypothetical protein OIU77_006047 [Salix suchowensis]|uniref:NTP pyrophosphohydrolase MazG putative catalytic core domain-containing protein n=1 Tax=Salix suchowensis TaxID=1278906 RepID=A0ABQ9ARI3_9ROSI|nr:hypothetical protein OIU77_006047 [Salix suchowensis]
MITHKITHNPKQDNHKETKEHQEQVESLVKAKEVLETELGKISDGKVSLDIENGLFYAFIETQMAEMDGFVGGLVLERKMAGMEGELSEIFQWRGEVARGLPDWRDEEKEHLGEELSDVLLYLARLFDVLGVDLGKVAMRKLVCSREKKEKENEIGVLKSEVKELTMRVDTERNGGARQMGHKNEK